MSKDSFTPRTTEQRLPLPLNGTIYTTTRLVASEKPTPTIGSTMESELGSAWSDSRIISVAIQPQGSNEVLVIQHARIPTETEQLPSNWEKQEVNIGGKTYDGVIRTVILLSSAYSEASPARKSAMPVEVGSQFAEKGYVLYDRACMKVGSPLEPVFRVERRTFIILKTTPGQGTGTWGVETDAESVEDEGAVVDAGFGIKNCRVSGLGNGWAVKERVNYPAGGGGIIHTLVGREIDEATKAVIRVEKSLVNAAEAEALAGIAETTEGNFAEIQPLDKWHSIMIVSRITDDPEEQTWKETQNISLPNRLEEIGVIWDSDGDEQSGFDGIGDVAAVKAAKAAWAVQAGVSVQAAVMGRHYALVKAGFSGAAEVTVVRSFHKTPPQDDIVAHLFLPVYATLTIRGGSASRNGTAVKRGVGGIDTGYSKNFRGRRDLDMSIAQIGPFEHSGITLTEEGDARSITKSAWATSGSTPAAGIYPAVNVSVTVDGSATLSLPTSSVPLESGETFIRNVSVSPWRLGYWVKEVYTAKVP